MEMRTSSSKKTTEAFLSNLKSILEQKGFDFDLRPIKRSLNLYRINAPSKSCFLFILDYRKKSFWEISPRWQDINRLIPSEHAGWAVILMEALDGEDQPSGFLISSSDFIKMRSGFSINREGRIKIHKEDLSLRHEFKNWRSFFRLLKL